MPNGKPAGVRCIQLTDANLCALLDKLERPEICTRLRPQAAMCGISQDEAMATLNLLEMSTSPRPIDGNA